MIKGIEGLRSGVENLWPIWKLVMAHVRILITQVRVQNRVKMKLPDKQVLR